MGAAHISRSLRGLIRMHNPSVMLVEETMIPQEKSWEALLSIFQDWYVCASNVAGHSGGLGGMWNTKVISLKA